MSIAKNIALQMIHELNAVNKEMIAEITNNNDLINSLIKTCGFTAEDLSNGEFTNTLSKSPNKAYGHTYHEFDEYGCDDHTCCECEFGDLEEDDAPCANCSNIDAQSYDCYYEPKQEHDPRPIKSYDQVYEPISHSYLECHNSHDCIHSISTCKSCKYRATKSDQVPCVGCNCIHPNSLVCFHVDDEN